MSQVRVRFAPSPTGYLHVGGARTALFNWLIARQSGGAFILRIEDTDRSRHVQDSLPKIVDDMRWLGLQWDEGPQVDGPYGPYFQSERLDAYTRDAQQLLDRGAAYYTWETSEELEALRSAAAAAKRPYKYRRPDPLPTVEQGLAARAAGKAVVVRFKMPDSDITVHDQILGDVELKRDELEDFVILKSDGWPTYHFAVVVDDHEMKVTHVLRGQEHLMNTPKHIALQQALGFATPAYAHLPIICNMDGSKMSKRDKERDLAKGLKPREIDVHDFRVAGYLPEALINFIALLGWSPGDDREILSRDELIQLYSVERVGKTSAKFDRDKLLDFNTKWAARVSPERLLEAFKDYLAVAQSPLAALDDRMLGRVLDVCKGFRTFADVEQKVGALFATDAAVQYEPDAVKKVLEKKDGAGYSVLERLLPMLEQIEPWSVESLDAAVKQFAEQHGVKLGDVAQPLRVALTGRTISPTIAETLDLLGRQATLARIRRCLGFRGAARVDGQVP